MPTEAKAEAIAEAKGLYEKSLGVIFTDYRGVKVKEMQKLRRDLKAKGGEIHVLKNTLFRIAAGESVVSSLPYELHNGPTAVAFIYENEGECAKVITDFANSHKNHFQVKGGYFGKPFDQKGVEALSKLPSRDQLIAQVIGAIAAPLTNLVGVIEALYADPIRVIGAVADKVAEGSPVPEPAAAAPAEPAPADEAPAAEAPATEEAVTESPAAEEAAPSETPEEN
ncbi:MAG: 50S ribosomal protein L10 [Armatimonadetes bacterium]|nr:50S ribosomal protein L10 [Armatimonadota bacterium]